jgi:hypothetical protein
MNNYPFIEDDTIPAPGVLDTPSDLEQLFLHIISHFYEEIDVYKDKTQLLISIRSILTEYIPAVYPQYISDYPDSLEKIYSLIGETIHINQERRAALPDLYALMKDA